MHDCRCAQRKLSGRTARGAGPGSDSKPEKAGLEVLGSGRSRHPGRLSRCGICRKRARSSSPSREEVFATADIVVQFLGHGANDKTGKRRSSPLSQRPSADWLFAAAWEPSQTIQDIADRGVTSFSVELMPRITRAQSMDALSAMATICGYKAVVLGARIRCRGCFPC